MKKLLLIGALLLAVLTVLAACKPDAPSESHTDPSATEAVTTEAVTEPPAEETDPDTPAEGDTLPDEPVEETTAEDTLPDGSDEETTAEDTLPDGSDEETTAEDTLPAGSNSETETTPDTEPEVTGPGKLVYVSNDELRYLNNMGDEVGCAYEAGGYDAWTTRTLTVGKDQVAVFVDWGWAAVDSVSYEFGYIVNGASFFSESYAREPEAEVVAAATQKGAGNCARFCGGLTVEALRIGENAVQFCVRLDEGVVCVLREYTVNLSRNPVRLDGSFWQVEMELWEVSGHKSGITSATDPTHGGMVAAGGVDKGALLHQGAVGIGTVDLSKYDSIIVYYGCDASAVTQGYYNDNPHNRILITKADTDGKNSPDAGDILAYADYTLYGWTPYGLEIDLTGVNYKGPVYITVDTLPGTFMLITSIELIGSGKDTGSDDDDTPDKPIIPDTPDVPDTPVTPEVGVYAPPLSDWEVSGHKPGITPATNPTHGGMVAAGGVSEGALLHQGAIGIGTVDLSKYDKIIVYYGCDASSITQNHYNASAHNRIMITKADTDGRNSPDDGEIIAYANYVLYGWTPYGLEIDLSGISYEGPVYITYDTLPGTFMLITSIELVGKGAGTNTPAVPEEKNYVPALGDWEVSGHKSGITPATDPTHGGMVAAGGVSEGALLHQGAIGVGTVDLSKYSKVIVYCGCDASGVTQSHYNASENNRVILSTADTDGRNAPDAEEIIAATTYTLHGWASEAVVIDLTGINYNGPVYISVDTLPGTFMLVTSIVFVA